MFKIKIKGNKKAVYLMWSNIRSYDFPDINETSGDDDNFTMICSAFTKYDSIPNMDLGSKEWDGTIVDLSKYDLDSAIEGEYREEFEEELGVLSGLLSVEISALWIPDDQWWIDAEMEPRYTYFNYINGEDTETNSDFFGVDEALELDFVTTEDLGIEDSDDEWDDEYEDEDEEWDEYESEEDKEWDEE